MNNNRPPATPDTDEQIIYKTDIHFIATIWSYIIFLFATSFWMNAHTISSYLTTKITIYISTYPHLRFSHLATQISIPDAINIIYYGIAITSIATI